MPRPPWCSRNEATSQKGLLSLVTGAGTPAPGSERSHLLPWFPWRRAEASWLTRHSSRTDRWVSPPGREALGRGAHGGLPIEMAPAMHTQSCVCARGHMVHVCMCAGMWARVCTRTFHGGLGAVHRAPQTSSGRAHPGPHAQVPWEPAPVASQLACPDTQRGTAGRFPREPPSQGNSGP